MKTYSINDVSGPRIAPQPGQSHTCPAISNALAGSVVNAGKLVPNVGLLPIFKPVIVVDDNDDEGFVVTGIAGVIIVEFVFSRPLTPLLTLSSEREIVINWLESNVLERRHRCSSDLCNWSNSPIRIFSYKAIKVNRYVKQNNNIEVMWKK